MVILADIKVKDIAKKGVKTINKAVVQTERFKDNIVRTKEKAEETKKYHSLGQSPDCQKQ